MKIPIELKDNSGKSSIPHQQPWHKKHKTDKQALQHKHVKSRIQRSKSRGSTRVVTQNCSPAPSQSDAVIMGLATHTKPWSLKNWWVANARALRTLATWHIQTVPIHILSAHKNVLVIVKVHDNAIISTATPLKSSTSCHQWLLLSHNWASCIHIIPNQKQNRLPPLLVESI